MNLRFSTVRLSSYYVLSLTSGRKSIAQPAAHRARKLDDISHTGFRKGSTFHSL